MRRPLWRRHCRGHRLRKGCGGRGYRLRPGRCDALQAGRHRADAGADPRPRLGRVSAAASDSSRDASASDCCTTVFVATQTECVSALPYLEPDTFIPLLRAGSCSHTLTTFSPGTRSPRRRNTGQTLRRSLQSIASGGVESSHTAGCSAPAVATACGISRRSRGACERSPRRLRSPSSPSRDHSRCDM